MVVEEKRLAPPADSSDEIWLDTSDVRWFTYSEMEPWAYRPRGPVSRARHGRPQRLVEDVMAEGEPALAAAGALEVATLAPTRAGDKTFRQGRRPWSARRKRRFATRFVPTVTLAVSTAVAAPLGLRSASPGAATPATAAAAPQVDSLAAAPAASPTVLTSELEPAPSPPTITRLAEPDVEPPATVEAPATVGLPAAAEPPAMREVREPTAAELATWPTAAEATVTEPATESAVRSPAAATPGPRDALPERPLPAETAEEISEKRYPPIVWRESESHGVPHGGHLHQGVQFPIEGKQWVTWDPVHNRVPNRAGRLYGNDKLIRTVLKVVRSYHRDHPGAPRVLIGDLSRRDGGPLDHHVSHQNGLDVDVYYPRKDRQLLEATSVTEVDLALAQDLVDRFVAAGAQFVFVGLSTPLHGPPDIVQPYPNHDNHMHVRIRP